MTHPAQPNDPPADAAGQVADSMPSAWLRMRSEDLFRLSREVEIMHAGRVYRLRLTQQNKLILTA